MTKKLVQKLSVQNKILRAKLKATKEALDMAKKTIEALSAKAASDTIDVGAVISDELRTAVEEENPNPPHIDHNELITAFMEMHSDSGVYLSKSKER